MNGYLLDTNVPSELSRDRPEPRVVTWLRSQPPGLLFLSVVTIGEIRKGIELLPAGRRRSKLEIWLATDVLLWFRGRIFAVTTPIADRWGTPEGQSQLRGTPLNTADGMIAATALEYGLTLVTHNGRDFGGLGVTILNPWDSP